jgi:crotonobetainyl-CoA:carnitine CoA-transferase CaiB-like acyl-CoA transferase
VLLEGLTVAVAGSARPLRFAARCLADLGAEVVATTSPGDAIDDAWLGTHPPLPGGGSFDVLLAERGAGTGSLAARATVRFIPVGSEAEHSAEPLDERGLTAAGGIAVAVGDPERPPLPLPEGVVDSFVGTHLAAAAIAVLLDGVAETEVGGIDAVASLVGVNQHIYLPYGAPWRRDGRRASGGGGAYPYTLYEAADGLFCMIGRTERDWRALLAAMGDPEWGSEERFRDPRLVGRHQAVAADERIGAWTAGLTRAELRQKLGAVDFACASVLRPEEVLELPALRERWRRLDGDDAPIAPGVPCDVETAPAPAPEPGRRPLVLDLAWVWSGPAVSVGLADLGCEVVKVESRTRPDNTRLRGAPVGFEPPPGTSPLELSRYFNALNRGKCSVELDLKTEAGKARLRELADRADVIVENLSAGVMDRWGVSPAAVHETNPGCVFVSMRGYRAHPSTDGLRAYAPALSSAAGMEHPIAYPGEAPLGMMTVAFSDGLAAATGLMLSLAGLWNRARGGGGAAIELSQHEAAILANGRNIVASQLGGTGDGLEPLGDDAPLVEAEELPRSPWISPDLFGEVVSPHLGPVSVSRLPWRRDGHFPELGGPGPELGADTVDLLRG